MVTTAKTAQRRYKAALETSKDYKNLSNKAKGVSPDIAKKSSTRAKTKSSEGYANYRKDRKEAAKLNKVKPKK